MDWNTFVENVKIFWNQPVPIIGFTVGTVIIGILFIVGKTSIGKKSLNKIKEINTFLTEKNKILLESCEEYSNKLKHQINESQRQLEEFRKYADEIIESKNEEIANLTQEYELKLTNYKAQLLKQEKMIKVICENSVNKNIKNAYEKYVPEELDLPIGELKTQIEEKVKAEYEDRIAKLEEIIYGERKETEDNQTASE